VTVFLGSNSWGKTGVRVVRLIKNAENGTYTLHDLTVSTELRGDSSDVYVDGDNAKVLSTDAQKNTVYAFAKQWSSGSLEELASALARHFVATQGPVAQAVVEIMSDAWQRVVVDDSIAPDTFESGVGPRQLVKATASMDAVSLGGGLDGLRLLKATGSEFRGFPRDPYTTGHDVTDRVLVTNLAAHWTYTQSEVVDGLDYPSVHARVHSLLAATFADVHSKSIQFSMRAMAAAVLDNVPSIATITLTLPNIHHNVADLTPFGLTNDREVLIPTERTHSLIEAEFSRDDVSNT
jgi:urate oxidase